MARRRRFTGRRIARGNFAKKRFAWTRAIFEFSIDVTGTPPDPSGAVVFDALTDIIGTGTDYNRKWNVRRIICRSQLVWVPVVSTVAAQVVNLNAALFVQDREDADISLVTTAEGDILEGGADRVLWTDCVAQRIVALPSAQISEQQAQGPRFDFDWRGNAKCGLDQLVTIGFQLDADYSGVLSDARMGMLTSVLFEAT